MMGRGLLKNAGCGRLAGGADAPIDYNTPQTIPPALPLPSRRPPELMSGHTLLLAVALLLPSLVASTQAAESLTYERDVRPIFKTHCFHCHGEAGVKEGALDLRLRRLSVQGGDSGEAIVPGAPEDSLLWIRMKSGEMPPQEVKHRPSEQELALVQQWIAQGAPAGDESAADPDRYFTPEERGYWAFQPIRSPPLLPVRHADQAASPIDTFILQQLETRNWTLNPEAAPAVLVRRLYLDLLGLPPAPEDVAAYLADSQPDAFDRLVDRLLASPHLGERWARHWLDVAGYADSEGYTDEDPVRPDAYKYRDYVIRAFNSDKPWDRFIVEQLAGDELLGGKLTELAPHEIECLIATGFLRMAPDGTAAKGIDEPLARNEVVAKTLQTVSTSLLGLTVACAQCHDHRYDPIPQTDYYALRAIFEPALDWKQWKAPPQRRVSLYTAADRAAAQEIEEQAKVLDARRTEQQHAYIEQTLEKELAKLPDDVRDAAGAAQRTPEKDRTAEQKQLLMKYPSVNVTAGSLYLYDKKAADELQKMAEEVTRLRETKPREEFVRALYEPSGQPPPPTFVFHRGEPDQPRQEVAPAELSIVTQHFPVSLPADDAELPTTGRRLAYARWLTSPDHPLVSRVLANRIWLHLLGRGIVATPGDFGRLGSPPTHPELLDWLAWEFRHQGWSAKRLQRRILTSRVYRQSSAPSADAEAGDAENVWHARRNPRRLEAELLRDCFLAVSGQLNGKPFGPAVPVMADLVGQYVIGIENLDAGRPGAVIDMKGEQFRRSIYVQVRRSRPLSVMEPFDLPGLEPNCTVRSATTVTPQSLLLMNGQFTLEQATAFARRVQSEAGDDPAAQIRRAWQLAFGVEPQSDEAAEALAFVQSQQESFAAQLAADPPQNKPDQTDSPGRLALTSFCHALLSSNRFLYVD